MGSDSLRVGIVSSVVVVGRVVERVGSDRVYMTRLDRQMI